MPRGGKRPGAGAPKGNHNALKHGRRSRQFAELGAIVAQSPTAREALMALADRWETDKKKADYVASRILSVVVARGLEKSRRRLNVLPPDAVGRTIKEEALGEPSSKRAPTKNSRISRANNQKPRTTRRNQSPTDTKSE